MEETDTQVRGIRAAYEEHMAFFDGLAQYVNNVRLITVDRLHQRVKGRRKAIVDGFRLLQALGLGEYTKGSRGHASRFEFARQTGPVRIGLLAQGVSDEDELPDEEIGESDDEDWLSALDADSTALADASTEDIIKELKARGAQTVHITF